MQLHFAHTRFLVFSFYLLHSLVQAQNFEFVRGDDIGVKQGSRGVSIADLDGNGYLDIVVANQVDSLSLLGNTILFNYGQNYELQYIASNNVKAWSESVHTVDVDNDRDLDLFFTTQFGTPNLLFLNNGEGHFTQSDASQLTSDQTNSPGACWCDYDLDGDMDVFVVNRDGEDDALYINNGKGSFHRKEVGPWIGNGGDGRSCAWGDINGDGFLDLYVANFVVKENGQFVGKHRNYLYVGNKDNEFVEQLKGAAVETLTASYGVTLVDMDYDHDLDIYVTNVSRSDENGLYQNQGDGKFEPLTESVLMNGSNRPSKGQTWGDFNSDGHLDLYVANGTEGYPEIQNFLFSGIQEGHSQRIYESIVAIQPHISAGAASGDVDNDGDLDIYVCNWGGEAELNDLYRNESPSQRWLKIILQGNKSNSFGIGSWVILELSDGRQLTRYFTRETGYGSENAPELHFGIPKNTSILQMKVQWPSGIVDVSNNIAINATYLVKENIEFKKLTND